MGFKFILYIFFIIKLFYGLKQVWSKYSWKLLSKRWVSEIHTQSRALDSSGLGNEITFKLPFLMKLWLPFLLVQNGLENIALERCGYEQGEIWKFWPDCCLHITLTKECRSYIYRWADFCINDHFPIAVGERLVPIIYSVLVLWTGTVSWSIDIIHVSHTICSW